MSKKPLLTVKIYYCSGEEPRTYELDMDWDDISEFIDDSLEKGWMNIETSTGEHYINLDTIEEIYFE